METAPVKCAEMKCVEPGSKLCCKLCPASPTYWRRQERPVEVSSTRTS